MPSIEKDDCGRNAYRIRFASSSMVAFPALVLVLAVPLTAWAVGQFPPSYHTIHPPPSLPHQPPQNVRQDHRARGHCHGGAADVAHHGEGGARHDAQRVDDGAGAQLREPGRGARTSSPAQPRAPACAEAPFVCCRSSADSPHRAHLAAAPPGFRCSRTRRRSRTWSASS